MAFELPALPNFNTTVPQQVANQPSAMDQYGRMLQLRSLLANQAQQEQLQPLQVQEVQQQLQASTLANQKTQQDLQSRQNLMDAVANGALSKYAGVATPDGSGFDAAGAFKALVTPKDKGGSGVFPAEASEYVNSMLTIGKNQAEITKTLGQAAEAQQNVRDKTLNHVASKLASIGDLKGDEQTAALAAFKQDLVTNPQAYVGMTKQEMGELYGVQPGHLDAIEGHFGLLGQVADFHKSKAEAVRAQQGVIPEGGGLSPETQQGIQKDIAVATNPQIQAGKVAVATAEGRARQLVEGMEKPVYAIDPQTGQKTLMSATDALQGGIRAMLPVTAKEVGEDTQLINRLGDVRQKIAQYEQNIGKLGTTVSAADQGNIAALIGSGKFAVGAFGTELPVDRLNAALQKENISGLSSDAKKLLVSYYNARESMQGYQRVLSGTGRANEKAMQLNLDALPNPAISDKEYAAESLKQFKQNLQIVGQGLPKIPGVKSPEEIEAQANPVSALKIGQSVTVKGKPMKVTAVHDDGSFDAQ
jgi:hypothetical protein